MSAFYLPPYQHTLSLSLSLSIPSAQTRAAAFSSFRAFQFLKSLPSPPSVSQVHRRKSFSIGASSLPSNMEPPKPKKVKHEMEMFGDVRVDNYYWLRDDSRSDPEVLAHLRQENAYVDHVMSGPFISLSLYHAQAYIHRVCQLLEF